MNDHMANQLLISPHVSLPQLQDFLAQAKPDERVRTKRIHGQHVLYTSPKHRANPMNWLTRITHLKRAGAATALGLILDKAGLPSSQVLHDFARFDKSIRADSVLKSIEMHALPGENQITVKGKVYTLGEQLGAGGGGTVRLARCGSEQIVVKTVKVGSFYTRLDVALNEVQSHARAAKGGHANVVGLLGSVLVKTKQSGPDDLLIALEYAPHGDAVAAGRRIKEHEASGALTPEQAHAARVWVMKGFLQGLHQVHRQGLTHLDVKLENFLIGDGGRIMICDFGLARELDATFQPTNREAGQPSNHAPELLEAFMKHDIVAQSTGDAYSLGVAAFRLFFGELPFNTYGQHGNFNIDDEVQLYHQEVKRAGSEMGITAWLDKRYQTSFSETQAAGLIDMLMAAEADQRLDVPAALEIVQREEGAAFNAAGWNNADPGSMVSRAVCLSTDDAWLLGQLEQMDADLGSLRERSGTPPDLIRQRAQQIAARLPEHPALADFNASLQSLCTQLEALHAAAGGPVPLQTASQTMQALVEFRAETKLRLSGPIEAGRLRIGNRNGDELLTGSLSEARQRNRVHSVVT